MRMVMRPKVIDAFTNLYVFQVRGSHAIDIDRSHDTCFTQTVVLQLFDLFAYRTQRKGQPKSPHEHELV